jgi:hypothetical protein
MPIINEILTDAFNLASGWGTHHIFQNYKFIVKATDYIFIVKCFNYRIFVTRPTCHHTRISLINIELMPSVCRNDALISRRGVVSNLVDRMGADPSRFALLDLDS